MVDDFISSFFQRFFSLFAQVSWFVSQVLDLADERFNQHPNGVDEPRPHVHFYLRGSNNTHVAEGRNEKGVHKNSASARNRVTLHMLMTQTMVESHGWEAYAREKPRLVGNTIRLQNLRRRAPTGEKPYESRKTL